MAAAGTSGRGRAGGRDGAGQDGAQPAWPSSAAPAVPVDCRAVPPGGGPHRRSWPGAADGPRGLLDQAPPVADLVSSGGGGTTAENGACHTGGEVIN
jgi:hypothetical protein